MRGRFILSLILCLTTGISNAVAGGSIYSRFGIGDRLYFGGSRLYPMANTGLSLHDDDFINLLNPAGLAGLTNTRISAGFEYLNFTSEDNRGSGSYARGEFQGLAFAFPVAKKYKASLLLEATPYSTVHYATESQDTQVGAVSNQRLYGSGGLTTLGIGGSFAPIENIILGMKYNYIFGSIDQFNYIDFVDATYTDSELQRYAYHSGSSVTLGGIFHGFGKLFDNPSLDNLSIGFVITPPTTLDVREETFHVITGVTDTLQIQTTSQTLPLSWGLGASYHFAERYTVTGDLQIQNWKPENFLPQQSVNIRRSARFGLGFEARPSRGGNSFATGIAYRAGIAYHSSYLQIGNEPIDELLVSGGLGLPIGYGNRVNVGLQVGMRGTTNNNLQKDTIFRLSVSLSASEVWFLNFEDE